MLVDSHCHLDQLDLTPFDGSLDRALEAANEQDVKYFLCISCELVKLATLLEIAKTHHNVYVSLGLHPNEEVEKEPSVEELLSFANHPLVIAIGETGLDYYRTSGELTWQHDRFRTHIRAAKQLNKPLIVHSRSAREDTLQILREEQAELVGGVMHCFTEDWKMAEQAIALGFYISFSGIVTFQNAKELKKVAQLVPLDKMLLETDSPYLAPVPHRGKPNFPGYVRHIAEYIAALRGITYEEVAQQTTKNFFNLFNTAPPYHV